MDLLLFVIGGMAAVASIIWLIVSLVRRNFDKRALMVLLASVVLMVVGLFMPMDEEEEVAEKADEIEIEKSGPVRAEEAAEPKKEEPKAEKIEESNEETLSQQNAVKQAEAYLSVMGFSKSGLVEQLEFEGYETADAQYAVDNISVDWKQQAVTKGKEYLDTMNFSRSGLIKQLEFEGFSNEQATYAADEIGL